MMKVGTMYKDFLFLSILLLSLIIYPRTSSAEFTAEDVLVLSNSEMKESVYLGRYYAKKRGIAEESIVELKMPTEETISRAQFYSQIVLPLKKVFQERPDLLKKRVLAVIYGTPLSIENTSPPENSSIIREFLTSHIASKQKNLLQHLKLLSDIERQVSTEASASTETSVVQSSFSPENQKNPAILLQNIKNLTEALSQSKIKNKTELSNKTIEGIIELFGAQGKFFLTPTERIREREKLQNTMKEAQTQEAPQSLEAFKDLLHKQEEAFGTVGVIHRIPSLIDETFGNETGASVDSELSILWLIPGTVPINSRMPNPLYMNTSSGKAPAYPLLIVSRLDGPNPGVVRRMIDTSISVEEHQSLKGNFLIDSRGFPWEQRDEMGLFDRDLVSLARNTTTGKRFSIEYDGTPELAGKTENVALYAGWYQVRNYQDSYTYTKGAIGYHVASAEAMSIKDPEEKGWCKNMLERGVVATIGAVDEPYLDSFPKPRAFFNLLLSGRYQLAEVYYLTTRYISWRLVLFGDPLYRPISKETAIRELGYSESDLKKMPTPPSLLLQSTYELSQKRE